MKIKIILAGNNTSRKKFLDNLAAEVEFKQCAQSINLLGTGLYTFRLREDDIEILFVEHCDKTEERQMLQSNYKRYAIGAKAIILVDADAETEQLLRAACPQGTPVTKNKPGKEIDSMKGVNLAVKLVHERQVKLAGHPQTVFKPATSSVQKPATQDKGVNLESLKAFLDKTPKPTYK